MKIEVEFQELQKIYNKRKGKWLGKTNKNKRKKGFIGKKPKIMAGSLLTVKGKAPAVVVKRRCNYCGGTSHTEDKCWKKQGRCITCGSPQHFAKDCRRNPPTTCKGKAQAMAKKKSCTYCGAINHTEDRCWKKQRRCIVCGSPHHFAKECHKPYKDAKAGISSKPQQTAVKHPRTKA